MKPQGEKLNSLDQFAQKLFTEGHYESVAVASRRDAVLQRSVYTYMYIATLCMSENVYTTHRII